MILLSTDIWGVIALLESSMTDEAQAQQFPFIQDALPYSMTKNLSHLALLSPESRTAKPPEHQPRYWKPPGEQPLHKAAVGCTQGHKDVE